jgi:hypothetical protein
LTYAGLGSRFSYGAKEMNPENGYFAMGARLYDATGLDPKKRREAIWYKNALLILIFQYNERIV